MPTLEISLNHNLTQKEALSRIKNFLPELKKQHANKISNLKEKWRENICKFSFDVKGYEISGKLIVEESSILIEGNIPFIATFFKSKIENIIRKEAKKILHRK